MDGTTSLGTAHSPAARPPSAHRRWRSAPTASRPFTAAMPISPAALPAGLDANRQPGRHDDQRDGLGQSRPLRAVGDLHGHRRRRRSGAGTPTGSVTFMDGTTTLGTGTLSRGTATFSTASLAVGPTASPPCTAATRISPPAPPPALTQSVNQSATTRPDRLAEPGRLRAVVTLTATVSALPRQRHAHGQRDLHGRHDHPGHRLLSGGTATFSTATFTTGSTISPSPTPATPTSTRPRGQ